MVTVTVLRWQAVLVAVGGEMREDCGGLDMVWLVAGGGPRMLLRDGRAGVERGVYTAELVPVRLGVVDIALGAALVVVPLEVASLEGVSVADEGLSTTEEDDSIGEAPDELGGLPETDVGVPAFRALDVLLPVGA